jgi:arabinose-5-phosphate isomerase
VVLDASVEKEACPINMLPTASTTVALALGDALVSCIAESQGFTKKIFASYHPGGSIGKRLNNTVQDLLNVLDKVAHGPSSTSLTEVARLMSEKPLGAFLVTDKEGRLMGLLTDGDLRRAVGKGQDLKAPASQLMNTQPILLNPDMLVDDAIAAMEQKGRRINCAPVIDEHGKLVGLVHIHDLI